MMISLKHLTENLLLKIRRLFVKKENEIYYINGPETLPPPLSKEEENIILKKSKTATTK